MTICERCSTENLDGSQYCDECGAPLNAAALAKKPAGTGNSGSPTDSQEMSEAQVAFAQNQEVNSQRGARAYALAAGSIALMDGAHARLVIERGRSAGKQFPLSDGESQIGRWDADGCILPDVHLDGCDRGDKVVRLALSIKRDDALLMIILIGLL